MKLHTLDVDDDQVSQISVGSSPDVEEQGNLDGHGTATTVSGPTPTIDFTITCSGPAGRVRAVEAAHLLSVPPFSPLAVGSPSQPDLAGYYAPSSVDREITLSQGDGDDHHAVPLTLTRVGSQQSHWRAVEPNSSDVTHDEQFGNDETELVAVPSTASSKAQWYRDEDEVVELASAASTRQVENGAVELYDLTDGRAAFGLNSDQDPWLIYEIDHDVDGDVDVRVWDTRRHESKHDDAGVRQWAQLFNTKHDFAGAVVLDSGALRVELDESASTIAAEEWDAGAETWTDVTITNGSDWSLFDVDITAIGMVRVEVQLMFSDGADLFALDAIVERGADAVLFDNPQAEEPDPQAIPAGIVDWLAPIAAPTVYDSRASKGLVSRQEVR